MPDTPHIRIVGDVHGHIAPRAKRRQRNVRDSFPRSPLQARGQQRRNYLDLVTRAEYSLQVGDLGLDYTALAELDPDRHRAIAGNHDNLPARSPHFLGDFGQHSFPLRSGTFDFFYVRGARSLNISNRTEGVNWWPHEELDEAQAAAALTAYRARRPDLVISHDCPTEIIDLVATVQVDMDPSGTNQLLQACFDAHVPRMWIFGHYHHNWVMRHQRGTMFVCVGELSCFDFDDLGQPISDMPS